MVNLIVLILFICTIAIGQDSFELSTVSEQDHTITTVLMQSVVLPCKAILLIMEPERVMWYKITNLGQSPLNVGKYLITKDPRLSVTYYSFDHGLSPPKWDLQISSVRLSDAARYQCHVIQKDGRISARSNIKLVVEDITVTIHPADILVSVGDTTKFSCNFTGQSRFRRDKITWSKDGKAIVSDSSRLITIVDLGNVTVTVLHILSLRPNDSGSYRCSNGHGVESKEAKLYLLDGHSQVYLRSLSSSTAHIRNEFFTYRTVAFIVLYVGIIKF